MLCHYPVLGASVQKLLHLQLAKKGINIILISRTLAKLELVAKEIEADFSVDTRVISVDFKSGDEIYEKIEKGLQGLDVGILVNNVGASYANPGEVLSVFRFLAF